MTPYILNLCDLALTLYALPRGGVELNPLMRNPAVMVAWKVAGVAALCAVMQNVQCRMQNERAGKLARAGLRICSAAFAAACIHNLIFIFGGAFLWQTFIC